ncbi:phosphotransferase family protein [Mycolicibacterium sp. XJ2546]
MKSSVQPSTTRAPRIGNPPSAATAVRLAGELAPVIATAVLDRFRSTRVRTSAPVPARVENITTEWLNRIMASTLRGTRVASFRVESHSSGTSVRARIHLSYGASPDAEAEQPPSTVFVKTASSLVTRIGNGLSKTSYAEAGFYNELRKYFDLEAPYGYYSAAEPRTCRAIHLLEDLVATRGADFCDPTTSISRQQADQIVEQLALLHGQANGLNLEKQRPTWLFTYPQWWDATGSIAMIRRYHLRGQRLADEEGISPRRLVGRGEELWRSFEASVDEHRRLPSTLIHNDTHLGNWYINGAGHMGLCDWQCVSAGHWSRDLAYALSSTLTVDQRRAWECELIESYLDHLATAGGSTETLSRTMELYRHQLPGALAMWTTTFHPPKFLPDMQPKQTSAEMLRRILTAIVDHDVLGHG